MKAGGYKKDGDAQKPEVAVTMATERRPALHPVY